MIFWIKVEKMTAEHLVYLGIVGLILLLFIQPIWTAVKTVVGKFWPTTTTSTAVTGITKAVGLVASADNYLIFKAAWTTLRMIDIANPNLDIDAELVQIESKYALAAKVTATSTVPAVAKTP